MKILYLLFPFFLPLVQGAAGASLAPGNEGQCKQEGGFCNFLTCYHPHHIFGRCSIFIVCCKRRSGRETGGRQRRNEIAMNPWTFRAGHPLRFWLLEPAPDVLFSSCLCRPQVV
ncbi:antimicrobial peptide THP1-like [Aptenodytes patagonicus]|uniref:antimicrobial peptide THP1-like n=1 Tax=Aptenodytes patagonicus TaxID=9234 RepID=UPI003FA0BEA4